MLQVGHWRLALLEQWLGGATHLVGCLRPFCCVLWMVCLVAVGCSSDGVSSGSAPGIAPTGLAATPDIAATATALGADVRDTGWIELEPGITGRRMLVDQPGRLAPVSMVRFDPAVVTFRVGYSPGLPRPFAAWCSDEEVIAAINGGFFDAQYHSTALVVSGGVASGSSYEGYGGMFTVDAAGSVALRYLPDQPYSSDEPLLEGMQGWPMLIRPGGEVLYPTSDTDDEARRSVIALDGAGRVLLLAFPGSDFTLDGLADWLASSDLDLNAALNLDGGSSTALCLETAEYRERIDPFGPLPLVLQVYAR